MKTIFCVVALILGFSVGARAEDWTGNLIDSVCYGLPEKTVPCDATTATTAFALDVMGKIFKLDATGNAKAAAAMKYRAAPPPGSHEAAFNYGQGESNRHRSGRDDFSGNHWFAVVACSS